MKNELEFRFAAIKLAAKETPKSLDSGYFDRVQKNADKIIAYVTKNGELPVVDDVAQVMSILLPFISMISNAQNEQSTPQEEPIKKKEKLKAEKEVIRQEDEQPTA